MKIVTDCAADMSADELEQLDFVQEPLFIQFPEGEVNSGQNPVTPEVLERLRSREP